MDSRTISKGEIVYSYRRQNRDNICAAFSGVYALRYVMESHITSESERQGIVRKQNRNNNFLFLYKMAHLLNKVKNIENAI